MIWAGRMVCMGGRRLGLAMWRVKSGGFEDYKVVFRCRL